MGNVWLTPRPIIEAVGPFDLDPCAAPDPRPWATAATHYAEADGDGLARDWFGLVWLNPPYKPTPAPWLAKLAAHEPGGVGLVFARTDAPWFKSEVWEKSAGLLFLTSGHLHFHHADGTRAKMNSGGASVLVGYGADAMERLARAGISGHLVFTSPAFLTLDGAPVGTWREALAGVLDGRTLGLRDIYAAAEGTAKVREAKEAGENWRAQVRRTLQRHFKPVDRAVWSQA